MVRHFPTLCPSARLPARPPLARSARPDSHPLCAGQLVKVPPARDHSVIKPTTPQLSAAGATRRNRDKQRN